MTRAEQLECDKTLAAELLEEWRGHNEARVLREQSYGMIACMVAMFPLDYLFFPPTLAPWATLLRVIAIATAVAGLGAAHFFSQSSAWRGLAPWILLPTPVVATLAHVLMVYWGPYESRVTTVIVTFGPCFAFYMSAFRMYKYLRELIIFTVICAFANALVIFANPAVAGEAGVFFFAISGTVTMFFVSRRIFARSLVEKFRNLRTLQPVAVAKRLTVSDKRLASDEAFQARDRFTVCLSSDWRNYQAMTASREPKMISKLFETYYNIVFETLAKAVPSGRYYADWTADEIMIMFYGDSDDEQEAVIEEALNFTRLMATEIPRRVEQELGLVLKFDIGLACGVGYLGLQGPTERQKATIAGEVPGTAKRLETEGKALRSRGFDHEVPNVVMDQRISSSRCAGPMLEEGWRASFEAGGKNVQGMNVTHWCCKLGSCPPPSEVVVAEPGSPAPAPRVRAAPPEPRAA